MSAMVAIYYGVILNDTNSVATSAITFVGVNIAALLSFIKPKYEHISAIKINDSFPVEIPFYAPVKPSFSNLYGAALDEAQIFTAIEESVTAFAVSGDKSFLTDIGDEYWVPTSLRILRDFKHPLDQAYDFMNIIKSCKISS
jgi:hypothetical protein